MALFELSRFFLCENKGGDIFEILKTNYINDYYIAVFFIKSLRRRVI